MENNTFEEIWSKLKESKSILMSLHPKPDGDSLGACTALKYVLEKEGKKVSLFSKDDLSENLANLEMSKEVKFKVDISELDWKKFDVIIFLDQDQGLFEYYSPEILKKVKDNFIVDIDHHETNNGYGKLNYVYPKAPSTCSILIEFFKSQNVNINKEIAERLFLGIATDTGFFTYANSNRAFKDAAFLSKIGVDYFNDIFKKIIEKTPLKIKKLQSVLLKNLEIINVGKGECAFSFIEKKDVQKYGLSKADLRLGIEVIRHIGGVIFELTLSEDDKGVGGSFRSSGVDVSLFAKELGGGGHKLAAGFVTEGISLDETKKRVFDVIKKIGIHKA